MKKFLVIWLVLSMPLGLAAQIRLSGTVYSAVDSLPVSSAYVVLKNLKTGRLIGHVITNDKGQFDLSLPADTLLLMLKVHHPAYHPVQRTIVWAAPPRGLSLPVYLKPQGEQLGAVVIDVQKPVIVKQDTVIYNIQAVADKRDETLEDVLKKFGDIQILPNGEIKVRGRQVDKVLVNGKEVSNVGPAVITRSINPEKVEKVEVRFRDKEQKFKESLLDRRDLVILDIRLKKDLKSPFFGQYKLTGTTFGRSVRPGAYGNFLYLRPKFKWHFIAEHDVTGLQHISLLQLSRMGDDRWAEMFRISGDFDQMKAKEGYKEELFGIDDYRTWERSIAGLTAKWNAGKYWEFFAGMFVARDSQNLMDSLEIRYPDRDYRYAHFKQHQIWQTKNKWYALYSRPHTRLRADMWFQAAGSQTATPEHYWSDSLALKGVHTGKPLKWTGRLQYEHLWGERWGMQINLLASSNHLDNYFGWDHVPPEIAQFLSGQSGIPVVYLDQFSRMDNHAWQPGLTWQYHSEALTADFDYYYKKIFYRYYQQAYNRTSYAPLKDFGLDTTLTYEEHQVGLKLQWMPLQTWEVYLHPSVVWPRTEGMSAPVAYMQWQSRIGFHPGMDFEWSAGFSRQLKAYSFLRQFLLRSFTGLHELVIYQGEPFKRYNESIWTTDFSYNAGNFNVIGAFFHGQSRGKSDYMPWLWHVTARIPADLKSKYDLLSFTFTQNIPSLRLELKAEPEFMFISRENLAQNTRYQTHTHVWLLGLKARFHTPGKKLQLKWYAKYTQFSFDHPLIPHLPSYAFIRNEWEASYLLPRNWHIKLADHTAFYPGRQVHYHLMSLTLAKTIKQSKMYLKAYNVLDNRFFFIQDQTPLYFESRFTAIQGRYFQLGYSRKF